MGKILFEHNQKAYEAAVSMLEETGRAAVIHPTGTGKSFIAFQLCADYAKSKICWLSPSEYIFSTQLEKWNAAGGEKLNNIEFVTYARLMRMGEEELEKITPDYIILDEFHRCGAAQWGSGVKRLREMYRGAKVLGLSATNIRYLDNQRDMAWELFGGNIASELTLGAAVAAGILPAPKYVLSVYSYQKELKRYELRVRQARNKAVRDQAEKELEALRRALEKADGLAEVFARHMVSGNTGKVTDGGVEGSRDFVSVEAADKIMDEAKGIPRARFMGQAVSEAKDAGGGKSAANQPDCGRYIVFCANYEHLLQMQELAPEWFAGVDTAPHIYTAYSDHPETSSEFAAFKADVSPHLKLLYCIDMLNEGIHVDGLSGVILLRPTVSPTVYKQQVGRALAAGGKETPVIFDIVMNIENLCSIGAVEEELRAAVFAFRADGREDRIVTEHFRVIDEVGDCRRLFAQLNETLSVSWDAMYAMAQEYYREHGNLKIPAAYATPDGYSLGAWILTQRKVYSGKTAGCLSMEQIQRLEKIGMLWQGSRESAWERNFAEAEKYFKTHGNLIVPASYQSEGGLKLGRWLRRQRELYQKLLQQEDSAHRQSVHMEHVRRLSKIGMVWENEDPWERRFALAKQYYAEHGNLKMPTDFVVEGVWLGRWLREQKAVLSAIPQNADGAGKTKKFLTGQQQEKLASIGLVSGMSKAEISWREQYGEAEEFYRRHGNLSIPKRYIAKNGKNLSVWLQHQRNGRRRGQLSGWQVMMLDGIGMRWEFDDAWEVGFLHAQEYFRQNGKLTVPNQYVCADGYRLGKWISNQRCAYAGAASKGLGEEQIRQLEAIGMVWNGRRGRQGGNRKLKEQPEEKLEKN